MTGWWALAGPLIGASSLGPSAPPLEAPTAKVLLSHMYLFNVVVLLSKLSKHQIVFVALKSAPSALPWQANSTRSGTWSGTRSGT